MSDLLDRGGKVVATFVPATSHSGHLPGVDAGNVEEGELSEGGLEDIYEPPESGFQEMGSTIAQMSKTSGASATHTQDATGTYSSSQRVHWKLT
jgi:hypothetical protein